MRRRPIKITVRFNEEEYKWLMDNVNKSCLRREPYIRALIADEEIYPAPTEEWVALTRLLSGMGNNLNQLTAQAHRSHALTQQDMEELRQMHEELWDVIDRVKRYRGADDNAPQ